MLNDAFLKIYVDPSSFGRFLPLLHKHRRPGEHNSASKSLAEIRGWKFGFLFFFSSHFLVVLGLPALNHVLSPQYFNTLENSLVSLFVLLTTAK